MSILIAIVGLPGSGKTHLANRWVKQGFTLFDDPKVAEPILQFIAEDKNVVITDPHLCHVKAREGLVRLLPKSVYVHWIFFENDPDQCWLNVLLRNDGRNISQVGIKAMSSTYTIPPDSTVLPVYKK